MQEGEQPGLEIHSDALPAADHEQAAELSYHPQEPDQDEVAITPYVTHSS
jgi:hypothetical protein